MARQSYLDTIDTIYPDSYTRERIAADACGTVAAEAREERGVWARMANRLAHWRSRRAGRLALRGLSAERLYDIGLTQADVARGMPEGRHACDRHPRLCLADPPPSTARDEHGRPVRSRPLSTDAARAQARIASEHDEERGMARRAAS